MIAACSNEHRTTIGKMKVVTLASGRSHRRVIQTDSTGRVTVSHEASIGMEGALLHTQKQPAMEGSLA